jgi:monoamine oxidase
MTTQRVLILGGGLAGLSAARVLARAGVDVDVIEAKERLGGRVATWHEPGWPLPVELGPEFVHGEPEGLLQLLTRAGLRREPVVDRHVWLRARAAGRRPTEMPDLWGRMSELLRQVDFRAADMSAASFAERLMLEGDDRALFEIFVRGFHAAPLSDVSIQSLARDVGGPEDADASRQSRPVGGYGQLVDWLSERLKISARCRVHLNSRALRVTWRPGHVGIDVQQGDRLRHVSGSTLLVTVSAGVLAARPSEGGIEFSPYLVHKREALWLTAMAQVTKVVLRFRAPFWPASVESFEFLHSPTSPFVTFWRQGAGDAQQVVAWAGAPPSGAAPPGAPPFDVRPFAAQRREGAEAAAVLALCEQLGAELGAARAALLGAHHHDYELDPCFRGAYSYVRPGGARARELLAQPVDDTLFFAGEATDDSEPATVAGALRSGERAARQILKA